MLPIENFYYIASGKVFSVLFVGSYPLRLVRLLLARVRPINETRHATSCPLPSAIR